MAIHFVRNYPIHSFRMISFIKILNTSNHIQHRKKISHNYIEMHENISLAFNLYGQQENYDKKKLNQRIRV